MPKLPNIPFGARFDDADLAEMTDAKLEQWRNSLMNLMEGYEDKGKRSRQSGVQVLHETNRDSALHLWKQITAEQKRREALKTKK